MGFYSMPAKKKKSWIRTGGQLSKVQMLVAALVVVSMGAGVYKLSSHAGGSNAVTQYDTVVSSGGGGTVYSCLGTNGYVYAKAVSTGTTVFSYWFDSGTTVNVKMKSGATLFKSLAPKGATFFGYLHNPRMGGYSPATLKLVNMNNCGDSMSTLNYGTTVWTGNAGGTGVGGYVKACQAGGMMHITTNPWDITNPMVEYWFDNQANGISIPASGTQYFTFEITGSSFYGMIGRYGLGGQVDTLIPVSQIAACGGVG